MPALASSTPSRSAETNPARATTGERATWAAENGERALEATSHTIPSSSRVSTTDQMAKYHATRVLSPWLRPSPGTRLATAVSSSPVSGGCPVVGAPSPPWRKAANPFLTGESRKVLGRSE